MLTRKFLSKTSLLKRLSRGFKKAIELPIVELESFIDPSKTPDLSEAQKLVDGLHKYGALAIRDLRVEEKKNEEFLDLMEEYFESRSQTFYQGGELTECFPDNGYQVGVTPELIEYAREHQDEIEEHFNEDPPVTPQPPPADKKWRFFWRIGDITEEDNHILPPQVIPKDIRDWESRMNSWGDHMYNAVKTSSEVLALGLGLERTRFTDKMEGGVQLLAPTGSDLNRYTEKDEILAGFHSDLNYLTIHGKSKFPGLYIWLRNGEKRAVKVPDGCLLIQAAKQLEYVTAGYFYAGFHEVIVSEETLEAVKKAQENSCSLWRVSSTLFAGFNFAEDLAPFPEFSDREEASKYPKRKVYDFVEEELQAVNLLAE